MRISSDYFEKMSPSKRRRRRAMERKALIISFICVSSMMFSSCRASGGIIKNVSIVEVQSKIYSEADIKSAAKVQHSYYLKNYHYLKQQPLLQLLLPPNQLITVMAYSIPQIKNFAEFYSSFV